MNFIKKSQVAVCLLVIALICVAWLSSGAAQEGILVVPPPDLNPLNQVSVPEPPQLLTYVKNRGAAVRLGKALFWDMQVGSDGIVACATCHHSAGTDKRLKNTLNPGTNAGNSVFGNSKVQGVPGFPQFKANHTLNPVYDFPLHKRQGEGHSQADPVIRDTDDVVGSQGVRLSDFVGVGAFPDPSVDSAVSLTPDPIFYDPVYGNVRRVTGRNTPTVINAVFNFSNFWDGRAHFRFNGELPYGPVDPNAGTWFNENGVLVKRPVNIQFASLASQAVGPPMDTTEMSGRGRTFPLLGRKMIGDTWPGGVNTLTPLGKQIVHPEDSVIGIFSNAVVQPDGTYSGTGLNTTYRQMIQSAFRDNLWNSDWRVVLPEGEFSQMEANFSLFWGLAIQMYEATLISDDTPFDRWLGGDDTALTDKQKFGFALFSGIGNCVICHLGTEFTDHSVAFVNFLDNFNNTTMEAMFAADGTQKIYDEGFTNNAVRPTEEDIGRGGNAPFINPRTGQLFPLSFSALAELQAQNLLPFETPILPPGIPYYMPINVDGSFKVPGLRNVELTGPYFHNGSEMTLDGALNFYSRGGNFPEHNLAHLDPVIGAGLTLIAGRQNLHEALIDFLKSLTDPRIKAQSAPFDHPELFLPAGDPEVLVRIPPTGVDGVPFNTGIGGDFTGDGKADFAVYRASTGVWFINPSFGNAPYALGWGGDPTDKPVSAVYDGDGKMDIAIYRSSNGVWYVMPSSGDASYALGWGGDATDKPVPADYDGDGKTDMAIYRASTGVWYIISSSGFAPYAVGWGGDATDKPVPADYDGDGKKDMAVYRANTGLWFIHPSSGGTPYAVGWGGDATDKPVPAVYDGDGRADIAVYRASTGEWLIYPSSGAASYGVAWGGDPTDIPVPADYDGDGKTDIAIYRASTGVWFVIPTNTEEPEPYAVGWGGDPSDVPVSSNGAAIN